MRAQIIEHLTLIVITVGAIRIIINPSVEAKDTHDDQKSEIQIEPSSEPRSTVSRYTRA